MSAVSGGGEDLIARLQRSLHDLGEHRLTHVVWRDWLLKDPANEQVNPHAGSAEYHDATIKNYDRHLANIEEAIRRLASASAPDLYAALADLEVCANSADYCYTRNPGNFALALRELRDSADRARATLQKARATGAATTDGENP